MLHDKDIREPLFDFLEEYYGKIRIIEEKIIGKSRADVVMITEDALFGIEIKSDADTYARLATQVKDYDRYYDFNIIAAGSSHAAHISEHVPEYWGIITVEELPEAGGYDFYVLRKPQPNPKVKLKKKLEILWRPELAMIQAMNRMPAYREKSKKFVRDSIAARVEAGKIEASLLGRQISEILFERDYSQASRLREEFRESERARKLEKENDPARHDELMAQRARALTNFAGTRRRRRRRRAQTQ